jgi:hypothetical protein
MVGPGDQLSLHSQCLCQINVRHWEIQIIISIKWNNHRHTILDNRYFSVLRPQSADETGKNPILKRRLSAHNINRLLLKHSRVGYTNLFAVWWNQYQKKIAESFPVHFCPPCIKHGELSGTRLCNNITAQFVSLEDIGKRYWSTTLVLSSWVACERSFPNSHWTETMAINECWRMQWKPEVFRRSQYLGRPHEIPLTPPPSFRSSTTSIQNGLLALTPISAPITPLRSFSVILIAPSRHKHKHRHALHGGSVMEHPVSMLRDHTNLWVYKTPQQTSKM